MNKMGENRIKMTCMPTSSGKTWVLNNKGLTLPRRDAHTVH